MREPALPANVPKPLDQELLAWAAGFFDGEGSTMAHASRPNYFVLDVSVPQSGPNGVPAVLCKFQHAMLGVGTIYAQRGKDHMYKWSAGGRLGCELTLALIWPYLGAVKRQQAADALDLVGRQYEDGRMFRRAPRDVPVLRPHTKAVHGSQHTLAFAWAAGFVDAEGYFGNPRQYTRKDGTVGKTVRMSATQHGVPGIPAAALERLRTLLGGRIEPHGEPDDFKWVTEGLMNVDAALEELRRWLGPVKVAQAEAALDAAESARVRGDAQRCARGHLYDSVCVAPNGRIHRRCSACDRMRDRAKRLERGGTARSVKRPPSDTTRRYRVN